LNELTKRKKKVKKEKERKVIKAEKFRNLFYHVDGFEINVQQSHKKSAV